MSLVNAIQEVQNETFTANGMEAYVSTRNACVDLFFNISASRGKDIIPQFIAAFVENPDVAIRIALHARDVREGAGERQIFRDILKHLAIHAEDIARRVLKKVPELGRWDDVLVTVDTPVWPEAVAMISTALREGDGLLAKWLPRKGVVAAKLRKALGLSPKEYRKTLVGLTDVVETAMCAKKWDEIDFSKVPSLASARYQAAFGRNAPERYREYLQSLVKGETKINAGAVYPYDVVKSIRFGNKAAANEQWKALPDFVGEGLSFLPVVDVSGSMCRPVGGNPNVSCLDVAISLGLYLSERNKSVFKNAFITFSHSPKLQVLKGNLLQRYTQLEKADWETNTNLERVFDLVLSAAQRNNLTQDDMPEYIVILSDMQFDSCIEGGTAIEMIERKFSAVGLKAPKVIFWNLNASGNVPVTFTKEGVALVSGCSPSIMKSVLAGKNITPVEIMLDTVMVDRYNW